MSTVTRDMLELDITEISVNNNGNTIAENDRKNFSEQRFLYSKRNSSRWQLICFIYIFVRKEEQSSQTNFKSEKV